MNYQNITAIVRTERLKHVEEALIDAGVEGITVTGCKGFGHYGDFFRKDFLVPHVRLDIFTTSDHVDRLVQAIMEAAHTGTPGDGLVTVSPVECVYRIRTKAPATNIDIH